MANAFVVFRVLANTNIKLVIINNGSGNKVVTGALAAKFINRFFWITIKLPQKIAISWIESVNPAITTRENDHWFAVWFSINRVRPLPMHQEFTLIDKGFDFDLLAIFLGFNKAFRRKVARPQDFACFLVDS